jgi:hypothetical protein
MLAASAIPTAAGTSAATGAALAGATAAGAGGIMSAINSLSTFEQLLAAQLGKEIFFDAPRRTRMAKLAGTTQKLAPLTGLRAQPLEQSRFGEGLLQSGFTALALNQNKQAAAERKEMLQAQKALMKEQGAALRRLAGKTNPTKGDFNVLMATRAMNPNFGLVR